MVALRTVLICLALLTGAARAELREPWGPADVSLLLPLPKSLEDKAYWSLKTEGGQGRLLPDDVFGKLPPLSPFDPPNAVQAGVRVVGIRLDPCFTPHPGPVLKDCQHQIRLVWQPLKLQVGEVRPVDAALHTFYRQSREDWDGLVSALRLIKAKAGVSTSNRSLWIHPALESQGLSGPFGKAALGEILKRIGAKRLTRVTFIALANASFTWEFGGFEITEGKPRELKISRIGSTRQTLSAGPLETKFDVRIEPRPRADMDHFGGLTAGVAASAAPELESLARAAHRIENPRIHSSETVDCASCHIAQSARNWMEKRHPESTAWAVSERFVSRLNLENRSPLRALATSVRAFGYDVGGRPALSSRTIHETAAVVESLNAREGRKE